MFIIKSFQKIIDVYKRQFVDREEPAAVSGNIKIAQRNTAEGREDYIKWVDFTVPCEALEYAYEKDVEAHEAGNELDWVSLLSCTAAKWGGDFSKKAMKEMERLAQRAMEEADGNRSGTDVIDEYGAELKYYPYYKEAYAAVLSGMVGTYWIQTRNEAGKAVWEERYGLKAFSPIAKGFEYSDYDDFGTSRSYGYQRPHLGHDMMGQVGTPVIAVESGYVAVSYTHLDVYKRQLLISLFLCTCSGKMFMEKKLCWNDCNCHNT